jgi:hypothetical protein
MSTQMGPDQSAMLSSMGVDASRLVVGRMYLAISYLDDDCLVPVVESLVFLGRNVDGEDEHALYFQDAESHREHGAFPNVQGGDARIVVTGPTPPPNLFELDGAVDELSRCAERTRRTRSSA